MCAINVNKRGSTEVLTAFEKTQTGTVITVVTKDHGLASKVKVSDAAVRRLATGGVPVDPPVRMLPRPSRNGRNWDTALLC